MITHERALETLSRYDIHEDQLNDWEDALGLTIPLDEHGNKVYTGQHISLFKSIKKHLVLGKSFEQIKRMIVLPTPIAEKITAPTPTPQLTKTIDQERQTQEAQRQVVQADIENTLAQRLVTRLKPIEPERQLGTEASPVAQAQAQAQSIAQPARQLATGTGSSKRYVSAPVNTTSPASLAKQGPNAGLLVLVDKLMAEKDFIQAKFTHAEKQRAHLYNANELLQRKVRELTDEIEVLHGKLSEDTQLRLIEDKSALQKQILDSEKRQREIEKELAKTLDEAHRLKRSLSAKVDPQVFLGNWLEEAELKTVAFDNFGINIESKRNRMFKITVLPERCFGHTAIIETTYDYQTNTLWKRQETLILNSVSDTRLEGELITEFILDGAPVARAIYNVICHRNGTK